MKYKRLCNYARSRTFYQALTGKLTIVANAVQVPDQAFAFLVDADLVPPVSLLQTLTKARSAAKLRQMQQLWLRHRARHALIVPAFERKANVCVSSARAQSCASSKDASINRADCWMYGAYDVPSTKADLTYMVDTLKSIVGFYDEVVRPLSCVSSAYNSVPSVRVAHPLPASHMQDTRSEHVLQAHCHMSAYVLKGVQLAHCCPMMDCVVVPCVSVPLSAGVSEHLQDDARPETLSESSAAMCMQWPDSHGCYDPQMALHQQDFYDVRYAHPCEPYVIALKEALPPFDLRWRGRELDKTSYITTMAAYNFTFTVNVDSFLVHLPHAAGAAQARAQLRASRHHSDAVALPLALTRVMLEDLRRVPAATVQVLPLVPGMPDARVARAMQYDDSAAMLPTQRPPGSSSGIGRPYNVTASARAAEASSVQLQKNLEQCRMQCCLPKQLQEMGTRSNGRAEEPPSHGGTGQPEQYTHVAIERAPESITAFAVDGTAATNHSSLVPLQSVLTKTARADVADGIPGGSGSDSQYRMMPDVSTPSLLQPANARLGLALCFVAGCAWLVCLFVAVRGKGGARRHAVILAR